MLGCTETITIVRHVQGLNDDSYTCEAIVGVSWHGKCGDALSTQNGEMQQSEYTVRIPASFVPEELPKAGDILVRGVLGAYTGRKCLEGREWFRVSLVGDNRRGRLRPHVVVKNHGR